MQIAFSIEGDAVVARVGAARIDAASAEAFRAALRPVAEEAAARVVVDLADVVFLDSSALGVLVGVMKRLGPGRRLELVGVGPRLGRIFALTGMDKVFRIVGSGAGA